MRRQNTQCSRINLAGFGAGTPHHTVRTRTRFFTKKGSGTFLFIEVYRSNRTVNEQRQGITITVTPCLLCYMAHWGQSLRTCVPGACTPLARCNIVPKSVCQGSAPLRNPCGACTHIRSETTKSYSILSITTLVPLATTPIILFAKVM